MAQIPGLYGRDWQNITMTEQNGVEYLSTCGGLYMDSAAAEPLFSGASSWSTIQADGYARWYQVGSAAAGKTMTVQVPEHGGFAVYDAAGLPWPLPGPGATPPPSCRRAAGWSFPALPAPGSC